jgi:hypothetical protein
VFDGQVAGKVTPDSVSQWLGKWTKPVEVRVAVEQ